MVITQDPMLCAIFSGIIIGFSLGIVIKAGASTGGLDIPPLVFKKRFGIPVSISLYVFDKFFCKNMEIILHILQMLLIEISLN